nr:BlaR1 family beta-lactam sensor/signal transducer [Ornithinibacillus massiliensis]
METIALFLTQLTICLIVSSFTVAIILTIKKVFRNQLSAKWQYNIWLFMLLAMLLPFSPSHLLDFGEKFITLDWDQREDINTTSMHSEDERLQENENWIQDFTISVNRRAPETLNIIIGSIWIAGTLVSTILVSMAWFHLRKIKRSVSILNNKEYMKIFEQSKQTLNISRQLIVGESQLITSPMTFGLFKTYVVLPSHFDEYLSRRDIYYIFLHELNHYKSKDILSNYCMIFFQTLYWFNPLVWYAFKQMRLDREIACDIAVLKSVGHVRYSDYGKTILHFMDQSSKRNSVQFVTELNGSKKQLKKRIEKIASFNGEPKLLQLKSIAVSILVGAIILCQVPFISAMTIDENQYHFENKQTEYIDLENYFTGYRGSFVLYDSQARQFKIYNKELSTTRISPDSTYKIYSALLGLEANVISPNDTFIKWDGTKYSYNAWNQNQDLSTAMANSVNWYFQTIDREVQQDVIQAFIEQIDYGNQNLSSRSEPFWLESSLKISPVEQVKLLDAFYNNRHGFIEENIQTVKSAIKLEEKEGVSLYGKTGTGKVNGKNINGWFIGFVETKNNTYFFATNIQRDDNTLGSTAAAITLSILNDFGIYK